MGRGAGLVVAIGLLAAGLLGVGGCGSSEERDSSEVRVVASTALITEFASTVAGSDAVVVGIIPAGVDIHSFEPAPAIAASIAQADLVLVNGHRLEETLLGVIEQNVRAGVPVVAVSDGIEQLRSGGHDEADDEVEGVDPHLWLDVANAIHYVERTRDALIAVDPAHEAGYGERAAAYIERLGALDAEVRAELAAIPEGERRLVVFHDAFGYFADAYGFELVAAVLPAGGQQDPSAGTIAELIGVIEESGVPVAFAEPQFSAAILDQIASEAGVEVGVLYSTYAGEIDSYEGLMRANAEALRVGLSP